MGYWKDQMLRELEQGYSTVRPDKAVCDECFVDDAIQQFVRDGASETKCSYCGRQSEEPIAASINEVLDLISESLQHEYADPIEENARDDGEWVIEPRDTDDVFAGLDPITENMDVYGDIVDAFSERVWVDKPLWGPSDGDALRYGWTDFVKAVKYDRRYVFLMPMKERSSSSDGITPDKMLDHIGDVINEVGLVRTMKAGTHWFRARVHDPSKTYTSAADLGTAPREAAVASNRMSPAGIPMFYGAGDEETAIGETYTPKPGTPVAVTVGEFETARDALVVDLTGLPQVPSLFDQGRRHLRGSISFLRGFVGDLVAPVTKDGQEHIEYVPTQIVTEYLRHVFRTETGQQVQGVIYQSARVKDGTCCVLFVDNERCGDAKPGWQDEETDSPFMEKRRKYALGMVGKPTHDDYP